MEILVNLIATREYQIAADIAGKGAIGFQELKRQLGHLEVAEMSTEQYYRTPVGPWADDATVIVDIPLYSVTVGPPVAAIRVKYSEFMPDLVRSEILQILPTGA